MLHQFCKGNCGRVLTLEQMSTNQCLCQKCGEKHAQDFITQFGLSDPDAEKKRKEDALREGGY